MNDQIEAIDDLESYDTFAALSANQGRILHELITDIATEAEIDAIMGNLIKGG